MYKMPSYLTFSFILLALLGNFLATNNAVQLSEIPCEADSDCKITLSNPQQEEIEYECVEFLCLYNKNVTFGMVTKFGMKCEFDEECNLKDAQCRENKCLCKDGFVSSKKQEDLCIPVTNTLGFLCSENSQCQFLNSFCENNKCKCAKGYRPEKSLKGCFEAKPIGSSCANNSECDLEFSECSPKGECTCAERYAFHDDACVLISRGILSPCEIDFQCQYRLGSMGSCTENLCRCKKGSTFHVLKNACTLEEETSSSKASGGQLGPSLISLAIACIFLCKLMS